MAYQLSFTTYLPLTNPDQLKKLLVEIDQAAESSNTNGTDLIPHAILKDLPYLDAVMHEALRLMPLAFSVTRRMVPQDWVHPTRPEIVIPAGTKVEFINAFLSRNEEVYGSDAASFLPDRWLGPDGRKEAEVKWAYMPFSRGLSSRFSVRSGFRKRLFLSSTRKSSRSSPPPANPQVHLACIS